MIENGSASSSRLSRSLDRLILLPADRAPASPWLRSPPARGGPARESVLRVTLSPELQVALSLSPPLPPRARVPPASAGETLGETRGNELSVVE
jgi:hypothetical protein